MSSAYKKSLVADASKRAISLAEEFKQFALKGRVIDLAVGVIIGAAFGKLVDSLVKNLLMPLISYVTPKSDFSEWRLGKVMIGSLLNDLISFLIIALAVFVFVVKFLGWVTRTKETQQAELPLTKDQALLTEIRDLLKRQP